MTCFQHNIERFYTEQYTDYTRSIFLSTAHDTFNENIT